MNRDSSKAASSKLAVASAWLAVGIPLLWGVAETFVKAMTLFRI